MTRLDLSVRKMVKAVSQVEGGDGAQPRLP